MYVWAIGRAMGPKYQANTEIPCKPPNTRQTVKYYGHSHNLGQSGGVAVERVCCNQDLGREAHSGPNMQACMHAYACMRLWMHARMHAYACISHRAHAMTHTQPSRLSFVNVMWHITWSQ